MKTLMVSALAMSLWACSSNKAAGRWQPYEGCGEQQCRNWNSSCEADCMNTSKRGATVDADTCMNQCRSKMNDCNQSCTAKP